MKVNYIRNLVLSLDCGYLYPDSKNIKSFIPRFIDYIRLRKQTRYNHETKHKYG